jgi:phage-related protein
MVYIPYNREEIFLSQNFRILYYVKQRNESEIQSFIEKQTLKTQQKIVILMKLLENFGPDLSMPHTKYLDNGLFELRTHSQNGHIRIFYFRLNQEEYLLTHAFIKKTNRTPIQKIKKAFRLKEQYEKS